MNFTITSPRSAPLLAGGAVTLVGLVAVLSAAIMQPAAAATQVPLGTAGAFAILSGTTVTNTGSTVVTGDLGVSPGSTVTGFPPGTLVGATHLADSVALTAQGDVTNGYNNAAASPSDGAITADLAGSNLSPGTYTASTSIGLSGALTLNGQGDPNAVFIFQAGTTLITASNSSVVLTGGAQACNVFWQVGSSATLGTGTSFVGTILAQASITATTGATVNGRLLARNGAVTLDTNVITRSVCATPTTTPTPTVTTTVPTSATPTTPTTPAPTSTATTTTSPGDDEDDDVIGDDDGGSGDSGDDDSSAEDSGLPETGGPSFALLPIGLGTIAVGFGVLVWAKRRHHGTHRLQG